MKLSGFFPAVFTPFDKKGQVTTDIITQYAAKLKQDGNSGVFVNGTTGEGLLLSVEERKVLAEAWIKHQAPDFKIIIHTGASSIEDAKELSVHASDIGADGFSVMAPLFLKPNSVPALLSFVQSVAGSAPDLPFYYYHIPQVTGVDLAMIDFMEEADGKIPNLKGLKYSGTELMDTFLCVYSENKKWDVVYGQDEKLLAGLSLGMKSAIGSTYNFMAPSYTKLVKAFEAGEMEEARKIQHQSAQLVRLMNRYGGGIKVGKRIMKEVGIDCGGLRTPGLTMEEADWTSFHEEMKTFLTL